MGVVRNKVRPIVGASTNHLRKPLIAGFHLHQVGVEIDNNVDQRTWYDFGKLLQQIDYAREWVIADWLAFGEHEYGDKIYQSAARLLGKSPRTWEDYAYIARNVKISERSEILPALVHRPVARLSDNPILQRKLLLIAEAHGLSKAIFEAVIQLYLDDKPYDHLLEPKIQPVERARLRAEKERVRVLKRAQQEGGEAWLEYAREQAKKWRQLVGLLQSSESAVTKLGARQRRARSVDTLGGPGEKAGTTGVHANLAKEPVTAARLR